MKIQRTTVSEMPDVFRVEMLFSNVPEPDPTHNAISICAHLPMEDRYPRLAELQRAALRHARTELVHEIHRLEQAQGRIS